jgi:heme/copper-type cytochrome/quinol oxidase subunit 2
MIKEELFHNREVYVMLLAGVALILYMLLIFVDLWKPRKMKENAPEEPESRYLSVWEGIPWSVRVVTAVIVFAMGAYTVYMFVHPVKW